MEKRSVGGEVGACVAVGGVFVADFGVEWWERVCHGGRFDKL